MRGGREEKHGLEKEEKIECQQTGKEFDL